MKVWEKHIEGSKRLITIGETRWWSKCKALERVFRSFENPDGCLYIRINVMLAFILMINQWRRDDITDLARN